VPVTPALAGEDDDGSGSATPRALQCCVLTLPGPDGLFTISFTRSHLRVGTQRARAVGRQTLRFQITRSRQGSPRFAG
jgi:hypothetical protein